MGDKEIRRTRTNDPEIDALVVIGQALDPLDETARKRVFDWLKQRYIDEPTAQLTDASVAAMRAQLDTIRQRANELGVGEMALVHTLSALREKEGLAPVEVRESIAKAEQALVEKTKVGA